MNERSRPAPAGAGTDAERGTGAASAPCRTGRRLQAVLSLASFAAFMVLLFAPRAAYYEESFFGLVLSALKGSFIGNGVSRASLYVLVAAYAVMLVCTAASLFCRKKAALVFNYCKGLCMLAAFSFFTGALLYNYGLSLSDVFYSARTLFACNATSLALVVSLLFLVALGFTAFGAYGAVKLIGLLLGAAFLLLGLLPFAEGRTLFDLFGFAPFGETALGSATSIAYTVYAWSALANFALAAISLALPLRNPVDALRADLFFVIAAASAAVFGAYAGLEALAACPGILASAGVALGQLLFINIFTYRGRKKPAPGPADESVPPPDDEPLADPGEPIDELLRAEGAPPAAPAPLPPAPDPAAADNFLDELTDEEKAEFERLFVQRSFRAEGLPAYVPGGDNRAFFRAVFAYLGAFREEISEGLLEKLDEYCEIRL